MRLLCLLLLSLVLADCRQEPAHAPATVIDKPDFCRRAHDNIDDLRASRKDLPAEFVTRVRGADWFIVNAIRLCTHHDGFSEPSSAGDADQVDHALMQLERWLEE